MATVAHLVAGAHTVTVNDVHQRSYPATIVAIDVDRDAALLRLTGFDARGATLRPLRPGEHGSFFAFGGGTPERWAFTVNRALGILGEDIYRHGEHLRPGYELRAQVIAGDSGAGLVALDGSLGGLVWAYSYSVDGTGWGISIDVIKDLLHRVGPRSAAAVACP